jgi:hypothetical protein
MKNRRLFSALLGASLLAANLSSAIAQPAPGAATTARQGRAAKAKKAKRVTGVPKRLRDGIEAKLGKPLTEAQLTSISQASATRKAAVATARDKFIGDVAAATGLTVDDVSVIEKPAGARKAAKKTAAAPAAFL